MKYASEQTLTTHGMLDKMYSTCSQAQENYMHGQEGPWASSWPLTISFFLNRQLSVRQKPSLGTTCFRDSDFYTVLLCKNRGQFHLSGSACGSVHTHAVCSATLACWLPCLQSLVVDCGQAVAKHYYFIVRRNPEVNKNPKHLLQGKCRFLIWMIVSIFWRFQRVGSVRVAFPMHDLEKWCSCFWFSVTYFTIISCRDGGRRELGCVSIRGQARSNLLVSRFLLHSTPSHSPFYKIHLCMVRCM